MNKLHEINDAVPIHIQIDHIYLAECYMCSLTPYTLHCDHNSMWQFTVNDNSTKF